MGNGDAKLGITSPELVGPAELVRAWERRVTELHRNRCSNCGGDDHLRAKLVVPREAGGQLVESNGVLLCRSCDMAAESVSKSSGEQRLVNFWVSRGLFDRLQYGLDTVQGFPSMGALVRYLITKYVADPSRFDDLELYQDGGSDVKVNVWVERDRYNTFKALLDKRGVTVTDALKGLIVMYGEKAEPLVEKKGAENVER